VSAFYLPGVSPRTFKKGERVKVKVNKLTSTMTMLPYDFYSLPFPKPDKGIKESPENLGEYLAGDKIENSGYEILMLKNENCKYLQRVIYTDAQCDQFIEAIKDGYHMNWIMDNLPSAAAIDDEESRTQTTVYDIGFPIGKFRTKTSKGQVTLNNHIKFTISYHPIAGKSPGGRIVGFLVEPISVKHKYQKPWKEALGAEQLMSCYTDPITGKDRPMPSLDSRRTPMYIDKGVEVIWTYDTIWRSSKIEWASRWDIYLSMGGRYDDEVHWFSIINALLIVLFLSGMVAMILTRSLHRDITRYNRIPTEEERAEEREESGWKLVHADVFRPPTNSPMLFCVFVGTGVQILAMSIVTLVFAAIGFLSPANRGSLMIALLLLFVLMGMSAGYASSRTYKMFKGKQWQRTTVFTAFLYPAVAFVIFFLLNIAVWIDGSVAAVPFGSLFAVISLWFGISVPLVFLGAYLGYRKEAIAHPVSISNMPRPVPEQPWYMSTWFTAVVGGVLPFGAVFVELFFILSSIWLNQFYYVFGFLLIVWVILLITCAEITVVLCYFQLCGEDYHWWWRSFLVSGASAVYVFIYSGYYFFTKIEAIYLVSGCLYFGYMFIISFGFFLMTGTVGFYSCFEFNQKIYASIKVD
jgi:transmembrane 9 superfamily protein 2/4